METNRVFNQSRVLLLLLLLIVSACKKNKDKDPAPDPAAGIAGTYEVSYISIDGDAYELPQGGASGTVQVTKAAEDQVNLSLTLVEDGQSETEALGSFLVSRQQDGTTTLSTNGNQIGTVRNNQLEINASGGGSTLVIRAAK